MNKKERDDQREMILYTIKSVAILASILILTIIIMNAIKNPTVQALIIK